MIDISATILDIAGVKLPAYLDGQPVLGQKTKTRNHIFVARDLIDEVEDHIRCVRTKQNKYIRNYTPENGCREPEYVQNHRPMLPVIRQLHAPGKLTAIFILIAILSGPRNITAEIGDAESRREPMPIVAESMEPDFSPRLGTYHYRFHWLLKIGAKAEISIEREDDNFVVATRVKTGWFVDRIYRMRYRGTAVLNALNLSPIRVDVKEEVRSTRKQTRMLYRDETIFSERVKKKKNKDPRYESFQQSTRGGRVMDPFSATLIARAMPWAIGDLRTIDVFDGRRLNRVTMTCTGQSRVKAAGERHDAWVIKISITQGDPEDLDEDDELITDQITAYLAADHSREVLKLEADTKFGEIEVVLDAFEPAEH